MDKPSRAFVKWYKDRDFPEVKSGNDHIVAVIYHPEGLQQVINLQNELLESYLQKCQQLEKAIEALKFYADCPSEFGIIERVINGGEYIPMGTMARETLKELEQV